MPVSNGYYFNATTLTQHNLGFFPTEAALLAAYPAGNDGDFAMVAETQTLWAWNGVTDAWVDTLGDVVVGSVELKDALTNTKAVITTDGLQVEVLKSALPTGAATGAKQDTGNNSLSSIDGKLVSTNVIGKVAFDQTTDNTTNKVQSHLNVGGAAVTTSNPLPIAPPASGALSVDISKIAGAAAPTGNGTASGALRVALPTDGTGVVGLNAGTNVIGKTGYKLVRVSANFVRPTDTNQYAIGDAISNSTSSPAVFQLDLGALGAVNAQAIEIRKLAVVSSIKQATLPFINVYLSNTTFTATNDNAALDIDDTTMEAGGAWFSCDVQNYTASNSRVAYLGCAQPIILAAADTKLYGTLQSANAYTPANAEKFTIIAWVALL